MCRVSFLHSFIRGHAATFAHWLVHHVRAFLSFFFSLWYIAVNVQLLTDELTHN